MSYWDKIKNLLIPKNKEQTPDSTIEFSPEELREMNDPKTAVGRLLNPQALDTYYSSTKDGPRELYYKGIESPNRSIYEENKEDETVGVIADAYIKDAEKRGIISPDEDRITKNYKIIDDLIKRKGLENTQITHSETPGAKGEYSPDSNAIYIKNEVNPFYSIDPHKKRSKLNLFDRIQAIAEHRNIPDEDLYEQFPVSQQKKIQKFQADDHLRTMIHELRHAEDYKTNFDESKQGYPAHFRDAKGYRWEDEHDKGKIHDVLAAALQRLSNIGTKKK
jgi:hypothetical protein